MLRTVLAILLSVLILVLVQLHRPEKVPKFNPYRNMPDTGTHFLVRLHDRATGRFFCSGSVISDRFILTAAHCVVDKSKESLDIEVRTDKNEKLQVYAKVVKF